VFFKIVNKKVIDKRETQTNQYNLFLYQKQEMKLKNMY